MNGKSILKGVAIVATALLCASTSHAAAVNLAADDAVYFGLASGTALPAGDAVYMGQFSITDGAISALGVNMSPASYAALVAAFQPLDGVSLAHVGDGALGDAGAITASYSGSSTAFTSKPIYILVVNSATTAGASQVGVFRGDASWTYPSDMATGSASIDTDSALTSPLIGAYAAALDAPSNGYAYDLDSGNSFGTIAALELQAVPEPSSYALVGMGLAGMIGLIRRRRQS